MNKPPETKTETETKPLPAPPAEHEELPGMPPATPVVPVTPETVPLGAQAPPGTLPGTGQPLDEARPWACPQCGSRHEHRSYLIRHITRAHKENAQALVDSLPSKKGENINPKGEPGTPDFSDVGGPTAQPPLPFGGSPVAQAPVNYQAMSELIFDTSTGALAKMLGPEWLPSSKEERAAVTTAGKVYLASKQFPDIPPGMMLILVVSIYCAPRFREPSTSSKLSAGWTWVKVKVFRRKLARPLSAFTTEGSPRGND
jgi:hypothetical protein